jgi:hypothetical protein
MASYKKEQTMRLIVCGVALAIATSIMPASASYLLGPNASAEQRETYERQHTAAEIYHDGSGANAGDRGEAARTKRMQPLGPPMESLRPQVTPPVANAGG